MKKRKEKKLSRTEGHIAAVIQDAAEMSITDIMRKRACLLFELGSIEIEITELSGRLADAKRNRSGIENTLTGLGIAIERR